MDAPVDDGECWLEWSPCAAVVAVVVHILSPGVSKFLHELSGKLNALVQPSGSPF
ncbi:hypothetical protein LHL20_04905 [Alteromonas sp. McT4-15]|uniref:hypothetical protein n=1 Tax=Alteromonadales TaxID=135622 RepID=UPI0013C366C5|nr:MULTISPECIES: hypothetical protein [Alteromonadales]MCB4435579.1 hypothetical protein [Alteromonas sp. McT4-15]MCU8018201.1 hypothetical protein [Shewanella sp. SM72]